MSITVFIPNYNHARYLPQTLDSVLSQSLQPMEILLFDDASTDNSVQVIEKYQEKYPVIRFIQNKENLGVEETQKLALEKAKGDYFVSLGADDLLLPDFLKDCRAVLEAHPDIGYCCGQQFSFMDSPPPYQLIQKIYLFSKNQDYRVFSPKEAFKFISISLFLPGTTSILYRTRCVIECGGFRRELAGLADWYLNFQILFKYGFAYVPKPFGAARQTQICYSESINSNVKLREKYYEILVKLIKKEGKKWEKLFARSGIFYYLGKSYFLPFVIKNPKYWTYLPRMILKGVIKKSCYFFFPDYVYSYDSKSKMELIRTENFSYRLRKNVFKFIKV